MSLINHTFYQNNYRQLIFIQQNQYDVLFAYAIATNYLWCTNCQLKSLPKVPRNSIQGIHDQDIKWRLDYSYEEMIQVPRLIINQME
jgi:hypothetical protein